MIRGIKFEIPQKITNTLWKILNCINVNAYHWHIVGAQEEVWGEKLNEDFFDTLDFEGKDFLKKIQSNHQIIFLKLQAYFVGGEIDTVQTYDDFQNGDCQLLLLIYDCEFVEIYCKDLKISQTLYEHAAVQSFKNLKYITDKNDGRTSMNIL